MDIFFELVIVLIVLATYFGLGEAVFKIIQINDDGINKRVLVGAAVFSVLISLLGPFVSIRYVTIFTMICGFVVCMGSIAKGRVRINANKQHFIWILIYMVSSLLISFYPSSYFDPLNYHLYGIVEWAKIDKLVHIKSAIQLMHASYADYLYFPITLFFDMEKIESLISLQVCSQLLTFFLGIFLFSRILMDFFKEKVSKIWIPLLILAAISRASLQHKGVIAKSDWIALSWFFMGLAIAFDEKKVNLKSIILASFLIGMSVGAKFSNVVAAVLAFIVLIFVSPRDDKRLYIFSLGTLLVTIMPYLCRNYIWTGNPLFPLGTKMFPTDLLGPSWVEGMDFFDVKSNMITWDLCKNKLIRIFTYEPVVYFFPFVLIFFRTIDSRLKIIVFGILAFVLFFIFSLGANSEVRHFGPIAIAINLMGVYGLILLTERLHFNEFKLKVLVNVFILFIFFNCMNLVNQLNAIPSAVRRGVFIPRKQSLIDEKRGIMLSGKLSGILTSGDLIAIVDDTPPYYFSMFNVIRLWDVPDLDTELDKCYEMNCVLTVLDKWRIKYLIESATKFDPYYRPHIQDAFLKHKMLHPEIVQITINGENLISVEKLKKAIIE